MSQDTLAPVLPPGAARPARRRDGLTVTVMVFAVLFLVAGAVAVGSGAYILAAELHSPRGEPIFWAGVTALAAGVALALVARLQPGLDA